MSRVLLNIIKFPYECPVVYVNELISDLEAKLAEIEKELKEFKSIGATPRQLQRAYQERYKYNERCSELEKQHNQNKINFAVEQLEQLKEKSLHFLVQNTEKLSGFYVDVEEIDNQIKAIKEKK